VVVVAALVVAVVAVVVWRSQATAQGPTPVQAEKAGADPVVTVGPAPVGRPVPPGFLGFSFEYWALQNYAGTNPRAIDPVLVALIHNLLPHQPTNIRLGGVSTDRVWWPVAGAFRPPGAYYTLTPRRLAVARALAVATDARLIMGVQLEANSAAEVAAESRAMVNVIGSKRIQAFELGNEPELYGIRWFYKVHGADVFGRRPSWDFTAYVRNYAHLAAALHGLPRAGPAIGAIGWIRQLPRFLAGDHAALITLHRYPMQSCGPRPGDPKYPTIAHFLSPATSQALAEDFAPFVNMVHAHHLPVRNAEMNSVSCGDAHGVANTFASALWAADALFAMARIGVDGVNLHTYSGAADALFSTREVGSRWHAFVAPEYYGVDLFSQAAPGGSHLLKLSEAGWPSTVRAWATRTPGGKANVVLINDGTHGSQTVTVRLATEFQGQKARLERLEAPSARAERGVTLGGQSFGADTTTGRPRGARQVGTLTPADGQYTVRLPAVSAALLSTG
jgi:hypothetical protein